LEFRILGPLEVREEGEALLLGGAKQRALIAVLLLHANEVVSADRLIDALWGERAPETSAHTLQVYVSQVRKAFRSTRNGGPDSVLVTRPPGYLLRVHRHELDLDVFTEQVEEGRRATAEGDPATAARLLAAGLDLWRGPPLDEFAYETFAQAPIAKLVELRLSAIEDEIDANLALGRHPDLVGELQTLVAEHPLRDRLRAQYMLALYRSGRQAEALEAYREARRMLTEELGIDPAPELQRVERAILAQDPALEWPGLPAAVGSRTDPGTDVGAGATAIQTFLIADVRGYSTYTQEYGDEAAGRLAARFAELTRKGVEARGGRVIELRGDEALAAFASARQAILAAVDLQALFVEQTIAEPTVPLAVGIGLDAGEAVPVEDGFRGGAINRAARLCALAGPAEILSTREVVHLAGRTEGVTSVDRGPARLKGLADPIDLIKLKPEGWDPPQDSAFRRALGPSAARLAPATLGIAANPYKGLLPFEEADTAFFFGREALTDELVKRLAETSFLAVVGPSGSGKSSVVRAGLIPALRSGAIPGSERWAIAEMVPGAYPLEELEAALLRVAANPPASLMEQLERDTHGLLRAVKRVLPADDSVLVLVIDQLEEVFTLVDDEDRRTHFLSSVAAAANDPRGRLRIVTTLRADFYDRPLLYRDVADLMRTYVEAVVPLTPSELERAIANPARRVDVGLEPSLLADMLGEVVDEPGALPLLQYALTELFDRREANMLTLHAYREIGGVAGALAGRADELYESLDTDGREACYQLFLRLVRLGEGTEDTRRRVPRTELEALEIDQQALRRTLDTFGTSRLMSFDRDLRTGQPTVEVAHESLLRVWGRLRGWIDDARDDVRIHRRLAVATTEWADADRDPSFLLRGAHLAQFENWATTSRVALTVLEREYVEASVSARDALRVAEMAEAQRQRRTNRRLRGLLAGVAILLALALVAGSLALVQRGKARTAALVALSQSLGSQGVNEPRLDRGLLLAREAVNLNVSERTRSALLATVLRAPTAVGVFYGGDTGRRPVGIALSPDGETLAVQYNVTDLELFDTSTFKTRVTVSNGALGSPVFSPDGSLIALPSAGKDLTRVTSGSVDLRDPSTGRLLRTLPAAPVSGSRVAALDQITFSRDGRSLYGLLKVARYSHPAEADWVVRWDVATGKLLGPATEVSDGDAVGFGLTSAGRLIVTGRSTTIWNARTMELVGTLQAGGASKVGASPDGRTMALGEADGSVRFVDLRTGKEMAGAGGHTAAVQSLGFTPDSKTAISTGDDGRVLIWDIASATVTQDLAGHGGSVNSQANDGRTLYTASSDGTIFAWDLSGTRRFGRAFTAGSGNETPLWGRNPWFAISPDGKTLAVTQADGYVNLWSLATLRQIETFRAVPDGPVVTANFSPDGKLLAVTGIQGQFLLWDLTASPPTSRRLTGLPHTSGRPLARLPDGSWYEALTYASFSPDGSTVAAGDWQQISYSTGEGEVGSTTAGDLAIWDVRSGDLVRGPIRLGAAMSQVIFNADGGIMAVTLGDGHVLLIDAHTLRVIRTLSADTVAPPTYFDAFSPDGRTLATSGLTGVVRLWDVASGRQVAHFLAAAGAVLSVVFDPTGRLIATGGADGTTRLWDAATGNQFGATFPGLENVPATSAFTPDGSKIVVVYSNGQAFVWPATWQAWAAHACEVAGRGFTPGEWRTFVGDRPFEPTCSTGPA
jgi:WD40 repeat protein/DNA-binding SARP family transcriptional activator